MRRLRALLSLAGLVSAAASVPAAAEVCRFVGTTSHDGRGEVPTEVREAGEAITVDVTLALTASTWLADVQYLTQEISTWSGGGLRRLAVNTRTVANGRIGRQGWDVFERRADGLEAYRVQGKTPDEFRRRYPGFARHWALAGFGQPWVADYAAAAPERRPDLDLPSPALPRGLRPPLALAFYWSRWLPPGGGPMPVFLPGFKHDARTEIPFGPAMSGEGWQRWQGVLRHPGLSGTAPSLVAAWVSPDSHLLQLAADIHARVGSGQALLRAQGCQGVAVPPTSR